MIVYRLNPKYAKRLRKLFRSRHQQGLQQLKDSVCLYIYTPEREKFTDILVKRLLKIKALILYLQWKTQQ